MAAFSALALDLRLSLAAALAESAAKVESRVFDLGGSCTMEGTWEAFSELVCEKPDAAMKMKAKTKPRHALNMIPSRQRSGFRGRTHEFQTDR
jgi:hypothetical protein